LLALADGTVFDENGRLALIKRADNGLWAMPGGAVELVEPVERQSNAPASSSLEY